MDLEFFEVCTCVCFAFVLHVKVTVLAPKNLCLRAVFVILCCRAFVLGFYKRILVLKEIRMMEVFFVFSIFFSGVVYIRIFKGLTL